MPASAATAAGHATARLQLQLRTAVLPGRFQRRDWCLAYSMSRHGISLGTLYRRAAGSGPSVLLIRDDSGARHVQACRWPLLHACAVACLPACLQLLHHPAGMQSSAACCCGRLQRCTSACSIATLLACTRRPRQPTAPRPSAGFVFGAFCTEPWHPAPRFFGTGETLVFQLAPHRVAWGWRVRSPVKNDFFQLAQPNALAVGGLGAFAIWLDEELLQVRGM